MALLWYTVMSCRSSDFPQPQLMYYTWTPLILLTWTKITYTSCYPQTMIIPLSASYKHKLNLPFFYFYHVLKYLGIKSRMKNTYCDLSWMRSLKHRHFIGFNITIGSVRRSIIGSNTCPPKSRQRREIVHVVAHGFNFHLPPQLKWSCKYYFLTCGGVNVASFVDFGKSWLCSLSCQQEYILSDVVTSTLTFDLLYFLF